MRSWKVFLLLMFIQTGVFAQSFSDNFDNGVLESPTWKPEGHNVALSTRESLSGSHAFRAYLPAQTYSNARSEIRFNGADGVPKHQTLLTTWGAMVAIYVPSNFKPDYTSDEIIIQYHGMQDSHDTYTNPPFAIYLSGYDLRTTIRWIKRDPGSNADKETFSYTNGRLVPGKWNYFVVDINWDYRSSGNGSAKVYHKAGSPPSAGDIIVNHNGPIGSKDAKGPYFKVGIYKWDWKKSDRVSRSKNSGITYRELYFDNVRIQKGAIMGNQNQQNNAPTASINGPGNITLPTNSATFTANANDSDGSISSYTWTKSSGPSATLSGRYSSRLTASNLVAGTYQFKCVIKDNDGASVTKYASLVVNAGSGSGTGGLTVSAGADFSLHADKGQFNLQAAWPAGSGVEKVQWRQITSYNVTESNMHRYKCTISDIKPGEYVYEVKITDEKGNTASDRVRVVVNGDNESAPAALTVSAGKDFSVPVGQENFRPEASWDPSHTITKVQWRQITSMNVYESNMDRWKCIISSIKVGEYIYEVQITDDKGNKASDRIKVIVYNGPATAAASSDLAHMQSVEIQNFSTDSDSLSLVTGRSDEMKVHLRHVNGVKLSVNKFDGELNTESLNTGMYHYDVVGENGELIQKGTILIY